MVIGKPGLLLFTSNMDRMCEPIAERFDVLRLWNETEPDAAIRERGGNGVAILTTGQDRIDAALMDRLPKLRLIVAVGAGYERVEVSAAKRRGITIANAGDTHSGDVADHTVALTLAVIQQIAWGREKKLPWGVSECAYSALDANQIYQYRAFGIPALALNAGCDAGKAVGLTYNVQCGREDYH